MNIIEYYLMEGGINMKKALSEKHKAMAYILNKEMGYTMTKIGELMNVSQSTISNGIKDITHMIAIRNLEVELAEARQLIAQRGIPEPEIDLDCKLLN